MTTTIRPYRREDLGRVLQLWDRAGASADPPDGLSVDQAVDLVNADATLTLVAEREGELVAMACASHTAALGSIHRLAVLPGLRDAASVVDDLVERLESLLAERGARVIAAVAHDGVRAGLERRDYAPTSSAVHLTRVVPASVAVPTDLAGLSGRIVNPGLWDELRGLEEAKQIIERRVILPLAEPALARRHGVAPPKAIVLFGPPGTGKTTFAKGIASRLGWPFVEIQPSELAGDGPERQATLLAESFDRVRALGAAVVFVDEVEDIASTREQERRVSPSITNEFLRQIPPLRQSPQHLLVCATNWVTRLDAAFLRPGRFDYVLPVGPPDEEARRAIWQRYVDDVTDAEIDLAALVARSRLFTPADIEWAAHKAAQRAFEREFFDGDGQRASTDDFLAAIAQTRPSLTQEIVASFDEETRRYARF